MFLRQLIIMLQCSVFALSTLIDNRETISKIKKLLVLIELALEHHHVCYSFKIFYFIILLFALNKVLFRAVNITTECTRIIAVKTPNFLFKLPKKSNIST